MEIKVRTHERVEVEKKVDVELIRRRVNDITVNGVARRREDLR